MDAHRKTSDFGAGRSARAVIRTCSPLQKPRSLAVGRGWGFGRLEISIPCLCERKRKSPHGSVRDLLGCQRRIQLRDQSRQAGTDAPSDNVFRRSFGSCHLRSVDSRLYDGSGHELSKQGPLLGIYRIRHQNTRRTTGRDRSSQEAWHHPCPADAVFRFCRRG